MPLGQNTVKTKKRIEFAPLFPYRATSEKKYEEKNTIVRRASASYIGLATQPSYVVRREKTTLKHRIMTILCTPSSDSASGIYGFKDYLSMWKTLAKVCSESTILVLN